MIRTEKAYQETLKRISETQKLIEAQKAELQKMNLTEKKIEKAIAPLFTFQEQLRDEAKRYEKIKKRDFTDLSSLDDLGKLLIALRIANGLTQRDLAERLEVSEAQVSRDERNEYFGITMERAHKVLNALNESVHLSIS